MLPAASQVSQLPPGNALVSTPSVCHRAGAVRCIRFAGCEGFPLVQPKARGKLNARPQTTFSNTEAVLYTPADADTEGLKILQMHFAWQMQDPYQTLPQRLGDSPLLVKLALCFEKFYD